MSLAKRVSVGSIRWEDSLNTLFEFLIDGEILGAIHTSFGLHIEDGFGVNAKDALDSIKEWLIKGAVGNIIIIS